VRLEPHSLVRRRLFLTHPQRMASQPQRASRIGGVDTSISPPCGFVAAPVHLAMVPAAEWNRELIADLAAECSTLRKAKVVGVRRPAATNQARLLGHESNVISVTHPARFRHGQHALVNRSGPPPLLCVSLSRMSPRRNRRSAFARFRCVGPTDPKSLQLCLKGVLYGLGISRIQLVLVCEITVSPCGGIITRAKLVDLGQKSISELCR